MLEKKIVREEEFLLKRVPGRESGSSSGSRRIPAVEFPTCPQDSDSAFEEEVLDDHHRPNRSSDPNLAWLLAPEPTQFNLEVSPAVFTDSCESINEKGESEGPREETPPPPNNEEVTNEDTAIALCPHHLPYDPEVSQDTEVEYEVILEAPDGGWGWMVLFGAILVNILIPGMIKSFGILFVEFIEVFEASPSSASWIPAFSYWLYSSTGPFAAALAVKWSHRKVTILGGFLASLGLMSSYFANSIIFLCISYGIISGLGAGLAYPIGVLMVGTYFDRRRGLANGLCTSGSALGSVLIPPVLRTLLQLYGYRKAVLILGISLLNVCLAAMFFDPVSRHQKKVLVRKETQKLSKGVGSGFLTVASDATAIQIRPKSERSMAASLPIAIPFHSARKSRRPTFTIGHGESPESWQLESEEGPSPLAVRLSEESPARSRPTSRPNLNTIPEDDQDSALENPGRKGKLSTPGRGMSRTLSASSTASISSFRYICSMPHGGLVSLQLGTPVPTGPTGSEVPPAEPPVEKKKHWMKDLIDLSLLKDGLYLVILASNICSAVGYTNLLLLLPAYAKELGFGKGEASYFLSLVAGADFFGRIGGAAMSDMKQLAGRRQSFYVGGLFASGAILAALPIADSFGRLAAFCSAFGLASGIYIGVTAVILADELGVDKLGSSYGISLFFNGIFQLAGPPLAGNLIDRFGYPPVIHSLGTILMLGAAAWICVPFIEWRRRRIAARAAAEAKKRYDENMVQKGTGSFLIHSTLNLY